MGFSAKQQDYFQNADKRWNIKSGATRSGKSYMDLYVIPKRIRARIGKQGLVAILGVSKGTIERNILEPMREIWGNALVGNIRSDNKCFLFGEWVYCLGAEKVNQVSKLRGASIKYCYGDEVADWSQDVFDMLKSRLDKPYSCFDGTLNPQNPNHWLKTFLESDADIYLQEYTIFDNPFLDSKFVEELCKEYEGTVFYDRYILGKWKRAEGAIYRKFADNPKPFYCKVVDKISEDIGVKQFLKSQIMETCVGVDFGGNKSGHAFVATAKIRGYTDLVILGSERHFGDLAPDDLNNLILAFLEKIIGQYGLIDFLYWDNAETVLGRGLKKAVGDKYPSITVRPARKEIVNGRIRCTTMLMGSGRFWYTDDCKTVKAALSEAVWDEKEKTKDIRLDDGSTDIDSLDALEYTFERDMRHFINV